ncbi:MAG: glycosyltransferase [Candidatus Aminicenantes bacterium]|nr:MAG: glycosyltransferase [Candidatus Aminicenantes bacterium]
MTDLTVLMTVHNGASYLNECMESILNQTYSDFKFLILDDASTDNSVEMVLSFQDSRIKLVEMSDNIGQIRALNKGLLMINTPLIARMDADDISLPRRFERQIAFLESHPHVGICGTFATAFAGKKRIRWSYPCHSPLIKVKLLFECSFVHSSVMMRKELLDKFDLRYDERMNHSYDWELWQRAARHFDLANIPEFLVEYRLHEQSESVRTLDRQQNSAERLDDVLLSQLKLGSHSLRHIHRDVAFETFNAKNRESKFIDDSMEWFEQLTQANRSHRIYSEDALIRFLKERLFIVLTNNIQHRLKVLKVFFGQKLYKFVKLTWTFKFTIKILFPFLMLAVKQIKHEEK